MMDMSLVLQQWLQFEQTQIIAYRALRSAIMVIPPFPIYGTLKQIIVDSGVGLGLMICH